MFKNIKDAVSKQFSTMKGMPLFRTQAPKDGMWEKYLSSFPEGTNPIFRERTEHDCQCCKSFIRAVGNMVTIDNGKLVSIWDIELDGYYGEVAAAMSAFVKSYPIDNKFLHTEKVAGVDKNYGEGPA